MKQTIGTYFESESAHCFYFLNTSFVFYKTSTYLFILWKIGCTCITEIMKKKFFYFFKFTIFLPINALNDIHLMFKIVRNKKKITVLNCFKSSYDTHLRLYNHVHVKWRREMRYNYTYSPSEPHLSADDSCCVIVPEVVAHRAPRDIILWDLYTSFGFR